MSVKSSLSQFSQLINYVKPFKAYLSGLLECALSQQILSDL